MCCIHMAREGALASSKAAAKANQCGCVRVSIANYLCSGGMDCLLVESFPDFCAAIRSGNSSPCRILHGLTFGRE